MLFTAQLVSGGHAAVYIRLRGCNQGLKFEKSKKPDPRDGANLVFGHLK